MATVWQGRPEERGHLHRIPTNCEMSSSVLPTVLLIPQNSLNCDHRSVSTAGCSFRGGIFRNFGQNNQPMVLR
jgi:hypothetical protein